MLAFKPSEKGSAAAQDQDLTRERKREEEKASGRSRWTNASTSPKILTSVPLPPLCARHAS
jgi:hypothetical protein